MERRERDAFVSPTEETVPLEAERTIASPRFDEKSVQRARPAVPLTLGTRLRAWPLAMIVLCVAGGVAGGVLGGLAIMYYQHGGPRAAEATQPRQDSPGAVTTASTPTAETSTSTTAPGAPTSEPTTDVGTAAPSSSQAEKPAAEGVAQPADAGAREQSTGAQAARANAAPPAEGESEADAGVQGELRAALGEWLAATNARDVGRQMNFYAPTVDAFYLTRNTPRAAVRAEKARVFATAQAVNVQAAPPDIRLSRDGRTAVMRFRKRYQITGGAGARSGEVLQELRWRRTPDGWKIVSERDLRVLQ
jgi:ketosteroid isomerase-like protein